MSSKAAWMIASLLVALAAGCGGGGDAASRISPPIDPAGGEPPPPDASVGGLWVGTLGDDASNTEYPIQVILSEDGRFRAQQLYPYGYPSTWLLLRGSFELRGRAIDGEGIAIADPGETWSDGESKTGLTISGTLDQPTHADQGKLLMTISMASGDTGRIEATSAGMSPYHYGSDLKRLAGSWIAEQGDNGSWYADPYRSADPPLPPPTSVRINVGPDGAFTGTDDGGCAMAGKFSLIDTRYSLWALEYTIRECDREGDYSGLALGDNYWYSTRSLSFSADDGSRSQALEFWQQ